MKGYGPHHMGQMLARLPELRKANLEHHLIAAQASMARPNVDFGQLWKDLFLSQSIVQWLWSRPHKHTDVSECENIAIQSWDGVCIDWKWICGFNCDVQLETRKVKDT